MCPDVSTFIDVDVSGLEADHVTLLADTSTLLTRLSAIRAGYLDELKDVNIPNDIDQIISDLDNLMTKTRTSDTLTADGAVQSIYLNNAPVENFVFNGGYVDLTNMAAGDTVLIKTYYRIKSGSSLILASESTYSDVQTIKLIKVANDDIDCRYGVQVTLQQTAGTNRTYDYEFTIWE